jgi:hypothetical protein
MTTCRPRFDRTPARHDPLGARLRALAIAPVIAAFAAASGVAAQGSGFAAGSPLGVGSGDEFTPISPEVRVVGGFHFAESCTFDAARDQIVVMNRGNSRSVAENDGYVSLVNPDGSLHTAKWIGASRDGLMLNDPLGSAVQGGVLYVADVDHVRMFDLETGAPIGHHWIEGATILNGIAVAADGTIFVTNTRNPEALFRITPEGRVRTLVQGAPLSAPNGVAIDGNGNVVVVNIGDDAVMTFSPEGELIMTERAAQAGNDGVVITADGTKYVSSVRQGGISRVRQGEPAQLIAEGIPSAASMCLDPVRGQLVVPMNPNNAIALVPIPGASDESAGAGAGDAGARNVNVGGAQRLPAGLTRTRPELPRTAEAMNRPLPRVRSDLASLSAGQPDDRVGLGTAWQKAPFAASNMQLLSTTERSDGFYTPGQPGDILTANSDLAFQGNHVFVGNFNGFQIYDVRDPRNPVLRTGVVCPGGQGDVSVHRNLLFMSVEMPNGRVDCGSGEGGERFAGVRIFDISNLDAPQQVAAIQTCRGSHTHTLVPHPQDDGRLYVYVQGTSPVRPDSELAGCSGGLPNDNPGTALFRIEIIEVVIDDPTLARVVNAPRIFADRETGDIAGLWTGGDHGPGTQRTSVTDQCHDITVYPEIGLAAGACSGNGILLDISDPENPVRIDEVSDPNFAYWHSATFNNDGTTVIFTDEWGGGMAPRCRDSDPANWGANAIFRIVDRTLEFAGYYKIPAAQSEAENCVAHNGSLVPVPGRDIKVQAWYQGGISVFDFSDPARPFEIAYFDRGPVSDDLALAGQWSTYWHNGLVWGSEIARGLDVLELLPSEYLTENELAAAQLVRSMEFNPQMQPQMRWRADFVVARAYLDQLERDSALGAGVVSEMRAALERAAGLRVGVERSDTLRSLAARATTLAADTDRLDERRLLGLAQMARALAGPS